MLRTDARERAKRECRGKRNWLVSEAEKRQVVLKRLDGLVVFGEGRKSRMQRDFEKGKAFLAKEKMKELIGR
jgi:hypothetical protein